MTEDELQAIEKLLVDITPGPWAVEQMGTFCRIIGSPDLVASSVYEWDAPLIASAPTLLRDLVAEVRRLNKLVDHFSLAVDAWEDTYETLKAECGKE